MTSPETGQAKVQALHDIVEARHVCFDVFRERTHFQGLGTRAVGYELVLSGTHSPGSHPPTPGCELCRAVYDDLKAIAEWILPVEHRPSFYRIEPYRAVVRATRARRLRDEVTLSIKILHRDHYEAPIDECETRCLAEMEARLRQIGAREGAWSPSSASSARASSIENTDRTE